MHVQNIFLTSWPRYQPSITHFNFFVQSNFRSVLIFMEFENMHWHKTTVKLSLIFIIKTICGTKNDNCVNFRLHKSWAVSFVQIFTAQTFHVSQDLAFICIYYRFTKKVV